MSLTFIGAGVGFDITMKGLKEIKECDEAYLDIYTAPVREDKIEEIEKNTGKKIIRTEREKLESSFLIKRAEKKDVVLIVAGDPLIATTHISLIIECMKKKIKYKIIHNSSIFSAACGKSGLQAYRFGKSSTLPYWKKNYEPVSSLETVEENLKRNLHTLLFLDIDREYGPMNVKNALKMIGRIEEKLGREIINEMVILSRVGYEDEKITFGERKKVEQQVQRSPHIFGKPPFIFIIPAKLHIMENEYLNFFRI